MGTLSYLTDKDFLKSLDNYSNKFFWVKIEVLDSDEIPIKSIEGRVQSGSSISLNGSSSVRRTCNINLIAEEEENDLTNIDNLLSANKKIKIFEGIRNDISGKYDKVIWFPLGVFVIVQPSISHSSSGCIISLSCKDKMCLLNGECAGGLPTSITFHEYDQIIGEQVVNGDPRSEITNPNNYTIYHNISNETYWSWTEEYGWKQESDASSVGDTISIPQKFYDIIQTLVCNYGGESLDRIFINDVPLEIKQIVRYVGNGTLYYNTSTGMYTLDDSYVVEPGLWRSFSFNEDVGYVYTSFTYPGSLVSSIGENVCSVLDKIKNTLGNYEYFYDVEGNFIFQEIKNYLNTSYDSAKGYRLDDDRKLEIASNGLSILDGTNYEVDFYSNTKSVYTFNEGNGLVMAYTNAPQYTNLKNDYHIWGENEDGYAIHYHIAIKNKPLPIVPKGTNITTGQAKQGYQYDVENDQYNSYIVVFLTKNGDFTGQLRLAEAWEKKLPQERWEEYNISYYVPTDWRAELYMQGLQEWSRQQRPDVYKQELLDLFDNIYNFKDKKFKSDLVLKPNNLNYFFDYLEPINTLYDCSVDMLGTKIYSYQQNKIKRLYNTDIPNIIMIDLSMDKTSRQTLINKCERVGQSYSNVNNVIYSKLAIGTIGYTAQEVARDLMYQYTDYNETITLSSIPIYYLDVNSRITVQDRKSGLFGDFIINSISLPLDAGGTMNITASRALERI